MQHILKLHRLADYTVFAYSTIPTEELSDHINITAEQASDDMLAKIVKALQAVDSGKASALTITIEPSNHWAVIYLEPRTSVLMLKDSKNTPKLLILYNL